jgi:hypothetical protein
VRAAVPPPSDAAIGPQGQPNGGTYARRYHDQERVNKYGQGQRGNCPAALWHA